MVTVGQLDAKALVETLADKLSDINAKTLALPLIDAVAENASRGKRRGTTSWSR